MEESSSKSLLSGYAAYLADHNLLEREVALNAIHQAIEEKTSYIKSLIDKHLLSETQVAKATSDYFGLPLFDITSYNIERVPSEFLSMYLVKKRQALPLFIKSGILFLAIADPTIEHLYEIKFHTGLNTRLIIAESSKLESIIDEILNSVSLSQIEDIENAYTAQTNVDASEDDINMHDVESAKIVNYLNKVLIDAVQKGASDIHFEPFEETYRIRYRLNGVLYPIKAPPSKLAGYLLARIKVISNLDITEHRLPQDGRFKLILSKKRSVDFRVSICPTLFGEKVVLRILDTSQALHSIDALGMDKKQEEDFMDAVNKSQGLILVTGPTGSGKTVTLYTALKYLNSDEVNISSVEDPVEMPMRGINQVNVNLKTGFTFEKALRSFLRQDPDVIMVGEIRDLDTAEIAVKAAQTGHLVLSTLHTNNATETIVRLVSMGIKPYNVASSITLVVAQRLIRVLCKHCKKPDNLPPDTLIKEGFSPEEVDKLQLFVPAECEHCIGGFSGRVAIFEVLPVTKEIASLIMQGGDSISLSAEAEKAGIHNLRQSGLDKVRKGVTSLKELNRVFR